MRYYRMFGGKRYHAANSTEWEWNGKAICGTKINHPAYMLYNPKFPKNTPLCKHCAKILEKKG